MTVLLRTRITLMVSLVSIVAALLLLSEGRLRENRADEYYRAALVAGDGNAWSGMRDATLERLEGYAVQVVESREVTRAFADGDQPGLGRALAEVQLRMHAAHFPASIEMVEPDGGLLYSSVKADRPFLGPDRIAEVLRRGIVMRGLVSNGRGGVALAVITPMATGSKQLGVFALLLDVGPMVSRVASTTSSAAFLIDRSGKLLSASTRTVLPIPDLRGGADSGTRTYDGNGKVFLVTWLNLYDAWGRPAGRLTTVRDVTRDSRRAALFSALTLGAMICGGLLFLAFLHWYMRRSFAPLNAVIRVLNALSRGDTSVPLVTRSRRDEIGRLAGTMENFRRAQQARDTLARLSEDLGAASRLQQSILPHQFPATPDYRLSALMRPAYDVGGDFYDFFELGDGRLGFVIADVSGKGMAAAMFMAMARTVIRSAARLSEDAGACLAQANDLLCASNIEDGTFVTVFYGILDPASGRVAFANGGHNPPYVVRRDGRVEALAGDHGMALGVVDGLDYVVGSILLSPGDLLFLYTDGVTEAVSPATELFGEGRLEQVLHGCAGADMAETVQRVVRAVDDFAAARPQADDITCLALGFRCEAPPCSS